MFDAERKITGPEPLETLGLPVTHIQAALRLKEHYGHHTYFFKSGNYWRLDPQENRVDTAFPRRIQQDWWGVPDEIDAAFQDANGTSSSAFFNTHQWMLMLTWKKSGHIIKLRKFAELHFWTNRVTYSMTHL